MIGAQGRVPVFAYRRPVDLRKGFEGLSALVQQALGKDPLSGALFLFTNRRRTTAKVLQFDGAGMYIKRLARGRFAALWEGDDRAALSLTRPELELFLQGSQLVGKMPLAPAMMSEKDLVIRALRERYLLLGPRLELLGERPRLGLAPLPADLGAPARGSGRRRAPLRGSPPISDRIVSATAQHAREHRRWPRRGPASTG